MHFRFSKGKLISFEDATLNDPQTKKFHVSYSKNPKKEYGKIDFVIVIIIIIILDD